MGSRADLPPDSLRLCLVKCTSPEQQDLGLRLLFAHLPVEEQSEHVAQALLAVHRGQLSLDELWCVWQGEIPVGATLLYCLPDGSGIIWPPVVTRAAVADDMVRHELFRLIIRRLDHRELRWGQVLLAPEEAHDLPRWEAYGFKHVTDLYTMGRDLIGVPSNRLELPAHARFVTYDQATHALFLDVLQRTYEQTLDCPWMNGLRSSEEALQVHQLSGVWEPKLWELLEVCGEPVGIVLLNDHPEQSAVELAYFGVVPSARGAGWGLHLLHRAIDHAARRGRHILFAGVDAQNCFANGLYLKCGFVELQRRLVLIRLRSDPCRQ
ncbi:MAG: hypothetical protein KatS3mg113_0371 [Planctomycetaceae bacterium]|nr:MAG: hypothetical protein KatS3mg113_0371 [Planctomycetaceae bacterium]